MIRHSIVARLNATDKSTVAVTDKGSKISNLRFISANNQLNYGIGQILRELMKRHMYPSETAIDLAILAATVTAADTKISRQLDSQDSWTREIDLYLPVSDVGLWSGNAERIERMLRFLTGDLWCVSFRGRLQSLKSLIKRPRHQKSVPFDTVCLFSGGLDSFVGAIDLLEEGKDPIFVSHYKGAETSRQNDCASRLSKRYGDFSRRHVRANVSFNKNDLPGLNTERTTRGRSFIFLALAALVADTLEGTTPIYVPENGLISLNVPLDPLRLGAWSTRTTHPYYLARWQELLDELGISSNILNPYRFKTKGEMVSECANTNFIATNYDVTISCSSITKGRWMKRPQVHCGYCIPCLIRRASIEAAFGKDSTEYAIANLKTKAMDAKKAEAADIRAFQMMHRRLNSQPNLARALLSKPGPLNDYSVAEMSDYANVFTRGIAEVGTLVEKIQISLN